MNSKTYKFPEIIFENKNQNTEFPSDKNHHFQHGPKVLTPNMFQTTKLVQLRFKGTRTTRKNFHQKSTRSKCTWIYCVSLFVVLYVECGKAGVLNRGAGPRQKAKIENGCFIFSAIARVFENKKTVMNWTTSFMRLLTL